MKEQVKLLQQLKAHENKWGGYSLGKALGILIEQSKTGILWNRSKRQRMTNSLP
jgi:hypothetical protein